MLKGIDPLLFPDLLKTLAEMGHDEAIVLTDANFSAMHVAAGKPLLRLPRNPKSCPPPLAAGAGNRPNRQPSKRSSNSRMSMVCAR